MTLAMDQELADKVKKEKPELYQQLLDGTISDDGAKELLECLTEEK
jgi:hypothetical protein